MVAFAKFAMTAVALRAMWVFSSPFWWNVDRLTVSPNPKRVAMAPPSRRAVFPSNVEELMVDGTFG
jgi:hypothetical protein